MRESRKLGCLVSVIAAAVSLTGLGYLINRVTSEPKWREPREENFKGVIGAVLEPNTYGDLAGAVYIRDEDGDGKADVITIVERVNWIAEGHKTKYVISPYTRTMTAEMRDVATEAMKADQKLTYLMARRAFELQNKEGEKK